MMKTPKTNRKNKKIRNVVCRVCGKTFQTTSNFVVTCPGECRIINRKNWSIFNQKAIMKAKIEEYEKNPKYCIVCGNKIPYSKANHRLFNGTCVECTRPKIALEKKKFIEENGLSYCVVDQFGGYTKSMKDDKILIEIMQIATKINNGNYKRKCKCCGEEFEGRPGAIFCSTKCREKWGYLKKKGRI